MVKLNINLPESFFQEEERDGYLVSAKTKELWAVQLDLLNEFDRVCKKHDLKYILDFGTLLGAIRHKGFIPWDDDIDVSMLREDYDKLMEIGPQEFKYPYFLQNEHTDQYFDMDVTRLRRSDTTSLNRNDILHENQYNLGVFLDIYAFDFIPNNREDVETIYNECRKYGKAIFILSHRPKINRLTLVNGLQYLYYKLRYGSRLKAYYRLDQKAKQFGHSDCVCSLRTKTDGRWCRDITVFENTIDMAFENLMLPIPRAFDEVLKQCYGDYMTPKNYNKNWVLYVDTDHSYKEIINEKNTFEMICKELSINSNYRPMSILSFLKYKLGMK